MAKHPIHGGRPCEEYGLDYVGNEWRIPLKGTYEFGPDLEPVFKDAALVDQAFHAAGPTTTYAPISVKSLKRKYVEGLIDIEEFEERLPACIEYSDRYRPDDSPFEPFKTEWSDPRKTISEKLYPGGNFMDFHPAAITLAIITLVLAVVLVHALLNA